MKPRVARLWATGGSSREPLRARGVTPTWLRVLPASQKKGLGFEGQGLGIEFYWVSGLGLKF